MSSLLKSVDDLDPKNYYAVYGLRDCPDETMPFAGLAFQIVAMNLPFIVVKFVHDNFAPPITLDTRQLLLMQVDDEYAKAQMG